jgi:hypothetical protein
MEIKRVSLFSRISNDPSITIFDHRNIFPIAFTSFYILVEVSPALSFIISY